MGTLVNWHTAPSFLFLPNRLHTCPQSYQFIQHIKPKRGAEGYGKPGEDEPDKVFKIQNLREETGDPVLTAFIPSLRDQAACALQI